MAAGIKKAETEAMNLRILCVVGGRQQGHRDLLSCYITVRQSRSDGGRDEVMHGRVFESKAKYSRLQTPSKGIFESSVANPCDQVV